ncbi:MAG TPA: hypothetical protein VFX96_09630 [Pyrinomonadaceae bacterium]|nr:hypothetical protein [Pyrinomonadaceae bacterium]
MASVFYRMFFDNQPADQRRLDLFEEIVVRQQVDMMWEARLEMPVVMDALGKWTGEDEPFLQEYARVRVEVKVGNKPFVPLIDGPITERVAPRDPQPGANSVTIVVNDDSVFLDQEDSVERFDDLADSEIAASMFSDTAQLSGPPDIEDTPPQPDNPARASVQRGTRIQLLRALARRHHMHAYVLPGAQPGASIGAFRSFPAAIDGLAPLIFVGDKRNLERFDPRTDARRPADVRAATLSLRDKRIITSRASASDATLLGDAPAVNAGGNRPSRLLPPGHSDTVDLDRRTRGEVERLSLATDATGHVMPFYYKDVLSPYRLVSVQLSDSKLSGTYLLTRVTHTLNRSVYKQEFSARRNAASEAAPGAAGALASPQAAVSAAVSFNTQGDIF